MQSNARKGGNAAEGGYKPAVQRMEVKVMARITDSDNWFGIWFEDKQSIINTMIKNMAADLDAGYDYFGTCIRRQQAEIETYKAQFDEEMDMFKDMEEKAVTSMAVQAALQELEEEDRELVLLRYVNEVPLSVICGIYHMSRFTCYRKLKKIVKVLKEKLELAGLGL